MQCGMKQKYKKEEGRRYGTGRYFGGTEKSLMMDAEMTMAGIYGNRKQSRHHLGSACLAALPRLFFAVHSAAIAITTLLTTACPIRPFAGKFAALGESRNTCASGRCGPPEQLGRAAHSQASIIDPFAALSQKGHSPGWFADKSHRTPAKHPFDSVTNADQCAASGQVFWVNPAIYLSMMLAISGRSMGNWISPIREAPIA